MSVDEWSWRVGRVLQRRFGAGVRVALIAGPPGWRWVGVAERGDELWAVGVDERGGVSWEKTKPPEREAPAVDPTGI